MRDYDVAPGYEAQSIEEGDLPEDATPPLPFPSVHAAKEAMDVRYADIRADSYYVKTGRKLYKFTRGRRPRRVDEKTARDPLLTMKRLNYVIETDGDNQKSERVVGVCPVYAFDSPILEHPSPSHLRSAPKRSV